MDDERYIVCIGAANFDIQGRSTEPVIMADSNKGAISGAAGGVSRNIAANLSLLGNKVYMMSVVGNDAFGEGILASCKAQGVDTTYIMVNPDRTSSTYLAVLDDNNDLLVAIADMGILLTLPLSYIDDNLEFLKGAAAIVCDPNLAVSFMEHLLDKVGGSTRIFVDPVSSTYAENIIPMVGRFYGIKPNRMELGVLSGKPVETKDQVIAAAEKLISQGTCCLAVSMGDEGCFYIDALGNKCFRSLKPVLNMTSATGAGDSFMAGFVHGCVNGLSLEDTLDCALACGALTVQSVEAVNPVMSKAAIAAILKDYRL